MREIPLTQGYTALVSDKEAAKAYDKAAIKYHGKFALINFPKEK